MKEIKVLGTGCTKCTKTADVIEKVAQQLVIDVTVVKETNPEVIMGYGVMSTPAVVIDDAVVHSGRIPTQQEVKQWLV